VDISAVTGKPKILFFWTTWCPYCRSELKSLDKMHAQMEKEGLEVFAIDVGEAEYKVQKFLKNYSLSIKVLLDRSGQAASAYAIKGVPTYIFIGRDGQVVSMEHNLPQDYRQLLLE